MEEIRLGLDVGFGFTKAYAGDRQVRFPTAIALARNKAYSEVRSYVGEDGREYWVGRDVYFAGSSRIEISSVEDLVKYMPIFRSYALDLLFKPDELEGRKVISVTGLPPKYYYTEKNKKSLLVGELTKIKNFDLVLWQGLGGLISLDEDNQIKSDIVILFDLGFNTVDYLIVERQAGRGWRKIEADSFAGLGAFRMLDKFREYLPEPASDLKNWSRPKLLPIYEKGQVVLSDVIDLSEAKIKAQREYAEILYKAIEEEFDMEFLKSEAQIVFIGGSANIPALKEYIEDKLKKRIYIPDNPEFANARGYYIASTNIVVD